MCYHLSNNNTHLIYWLSEKQWSQGLIPLTHSGKDRTDSLFHIYDCSLFKHTILLLHLTPARMGRCNLVAAALLMLIAAAVAYGKSPPPPPLSRLLVGRTLVPHAGSLGAVCLDGSPPAYHLHRGSGSGVQNWLLQFEGGGWCNDVASCLERSRTRRGSTRYMNRIEVFSGILSNDSGANPDFYNWNRVKLRYCDGASFAGDSEYHHNKTTLYFKGQRIWEAIILDLLPKGLLLAKKALLSGCSAGGLATFLHCDDFAQLLPETAIVKCMSDAGFFLNVRDISGNNTIEPFFNGVVTLQGVQGNLNQTCLASQSYPYQCFFPQTALTYIRTPYFILNSAYDVYQFHHTFVPPTADPHGHWNRCKFNLAACTVNQIAILQVFRYKMLSALRSFRNSTAGGMFINSCFTHCQSELQETWFSPDSPKLHNKTIAEAVGDWYFERNVTKDVDCPYPCGSTCHNLLPSNQANNLPHM